MNTNFNINKNNSQISNQGFLWSISDPKTDKFIHLVCMEGYLWKNPLETNPKIKEIFQLADVLYLEHPPYENIAWNSSKSICLLRKMHESLIEEDKIFLLEFKKIACEYFSKTNLLPNYKELFDRISTGEELSLHQEVLGFISILFKNYLDERCVASENDFFYSLSQLDKEVHFLLSKEEYLTKEDSIILNSLNAVFKKPFLLILKHLFKNEELLHFFLRPFEQDHNAWARGDFSSFRKSVVSSNAVLSKSMKDIINEINTTCPSADQESISNEMRNAYDEKENIEKQHRDLLLNKIKETLQSKKRSIIVLNSAMVSVKEGIISAVENMGLKIQQISIPMKAVGFFWKLTIDNKKAFTRNGSYNHERRS